MTVFKKDYSNVKLSTSYATLALQLLDQYTNEEQLIWGWSSSCTRPQRRLGWWPGFIRRQVFFQASLYHSPCCNIRYWEQVTGSLAHLLLGVRCGEIVSYMGWGQGHVRRWGQKGGLGGLPTPLVVLNARSMRSTLLFLSTSWFYISRQF